MTSLTSNARLEGDTDDGPTDAPGQVRKVLRWTIPVLVLLLVVLAGWHQFTSLDLHAVHRSFRQVGLLTMLGLMVFGLLVYSVNTVYDLLLSRWLALPVRLSYVLRYSWLAGALNNVVGFSGITGSGIRYLALTRAGASATQALSVAGLVLFTIPVGLSVLATGVLLTRQQDVLQFPGVSYSIVLLVLAGTAVYWPLFLMVAGHGPLHRRFLEDTPVLQPVHRLLLVIASTSDWLLTGALLWVCLRAVPLDVPFGTTLAAFTLAQALGLISLVPGGLGVFEGAMLMLLGGAGAPAASILTGLVLFRAAYYFMPFVFAAQLLPGLHLVPEGGALDALAQRLRNHPVLRLGHLPLRFFASIGTRVLSYAIFAAGALLLITAAFPEVSEQIAVLNRYLPMLLREGFHLSSVIAGTLLLLQSRGIRAGMRSAYHTTQIVLLTGALFAMLRGIDIGETILLCTLSLLLYSNRDSFRHRGYPLTSRRSLRWLLATLATLLLAGVLGHALYGSDQLLSAITRVDYNLPAASYARALLAMSLSFLAWLGWTWYAMPRPAVALPAPAVLLDAERFYTDEACTSYSWLSLMGDKYFHWAQDRHSVIQYGIKRNHMVALGDPACTEADLPQAIQGFRDYAADYDMVPVFYQVEEAHLHHYHEAGFHLLKLGESARVPLEGFTLKGSKALKLRQAINRGEREGLQFELLEQPLDEATWARLQTISDAWLHDKKLAEIGFSLGYFERNYLARGPIAVIRQKQQIIAFASVIQDFGHRQELSIDLMRQTAEAPHGTMDYLFVSLLGYAQQAGYQWFDLGMAPLSGVGQSAWSPRNERLLRLVYRFGDRLYNYQGLRHYKEKFRPTWRGMYLAYPRGHALTPVLLDVTALITGGYRRVLQA